MIKTEKPKVVFYNPEDKYINEYTLEIAETIKSLYQKIENIDGLEVYLVE